MLDTFHGQQMTSYQGSIILRRNRAYNKETQGYKESGQIHYANAQRQFSLNEVMMEPEYIVFNHKEKKCIMENEASKILGDSYRYNLAYNHINKLGDDRSTPQCTALLEKYQQCSNKFNAYQACDTLLDNVMLNREKINNLSHNSDFLFDIE